MPEPLQAFIDDVELVLSATDDEGRSVPIACEALRHTRCSAAVGFVVAAIIALEIAAGLHFR